LNFDMNTGSQSYFAVNFDSIAGANNFVSSTSGGIFPPPPPPIPPSVYSLPYDLVGTYPDEFSRGYTAGQIGNDPTLRNNVGSFTLGLIVGNGALGSSATCLDTAWYHDLFRIHPLSADFEIISPTATKKHMCVGDDAYFELDNPVQENISVLRWAWGAPRYRDWT